MESDDDARRRMAAVLTGSAIGKEATKKVAAEKKSEKKSGKPAKKGLFGFGGSKPTNERVAAFFHTHPNTGEEGYDKGPSGADIAFADGNGYPGVVRSQIGGYTWFGPDPN